MDKSLACGCITGVETTAHERPNGIGGAAVIDQQGAWQSGFGAASGSSFSPLLVNAADPVAQGSEIFGRQIIPQILHDPRDFGNTCSNRQMAAPIASLPASRGRCRLGLRRLLQGFVCDPSSTVGNVDQRQKCWTAVESLAGAHAPRVPSAAFESNKRGYAAPCVL